MNELEKTLFEVTTNGLKDEDKTIPLHVNKVCIGVDIIITDPNRFDPLATATAIIILVNQ